MLEVETGTKYLEGLMTQASGDTKYRFACATNPFLESRAPHLVTSASLKPVTATLPWHRTRFFLGGVYVKMPAAVIYPATMIIYRNLTLCARTHGAGVPSRYQRSIHRTCNVVPPVATDCSSSMQTESGT